MAKNIQMNVLGSDGQYEDIYPQTTVGNIVDIQDNYYTKNETLTNATAQEYGYTDVDSVVPNNLFNILKKAALFFPGSTPLYTEVNVNLSTVQPGDIVKLEKNGKLSDFIVGSINYEPGLNGPGRVLLFDPEILRSYRFGDSNSLQNSDLLSYLNSTYKDTLGQTVRDAVGTTTYQYTNNSILTTRKDSIFPLSITELGLSVPEGNINAEGSLLPGANAILDSINTPMWTRTPCIREDIDVTRYVYYCQKGWANFLTSTNESIYRASFTLPNTFNQTYYSDDYGNIYDKQVILDTSYTTDVKGNKIVIGAQISIGTYVGTGTYGQNNPNTLKFGFEPKIVFISSNYDNNNGQFCAVFFTSMLNSSAVPCGWFDISGESTLSNPNAPNWAKKSDDGKTLIYYTSTGVAAYQGNASGIIYYYLAIG